MLDKAMQHILSLLVVVALLAGNASALEKLDATVSKDITVLADPSLSVPLVRIARRYGEIYNISVSTSFGSSKNHITQIREGQEGDIFITAKTSWIKQLQQEGLMDVYSRTSIARNQLAIVAPIARKGQADSLPQMALHMAESKREMSFALGDPEYVAEGTYTLETLSHYKLGGDLEPYYSILNSSYSLKNTIANHDAYGAIFLTDALLYPDITRVETVDESAHQPIVYQAATIVGENMDQASHFLNFLRGNEAQGILRDYGFLAAY